MNEKKQNELKEGMKAPQFVLPDKDSKEVALKDFKGKWVVLYFYPKDNTSGCTTEAIDFTRAAPDFKKAGGEILAVSPDSPDSHCNFYDKHELGIRLLSDQKKSVIQSYGVWALKNMYGKEYYGVQRSTFLIDPDGMIRNIWRKVKVPGHAAEVLDTLKAHK